MAEGSVRVKNIASITANGKTTENVLSFREEHIMNMTPQFIPNVFQGADMLQREKFRRLVITIDSETDIFGIPGTEVNWFVAAVNVVVGTAIVAVFDVTPVTGAATTETWTYETSESWIERKEFGRIEDGVRRNTFEYVIICFGTKEIT